MSSAAMPPPAISASAIFASRPDAPTRRLPVMSFSNASRTEGVDASSQRATRSGSSAFGVSPSERTTSARPGGPELVGDAGHISATVSARSPT